MDKPSSEVFEQLILDGINTTEPVRNTPEESSLELIRGTLAHFMPGVEIVYDTENDETVLR